MTHQTYSNSMLDTAREHIGALLAAYHGATGYPMTFCTHVACRDMKFASAYLTNNFTIRTYDTFVSRLSAVWPAGAVWPSNVPRQNPAIMDDETLSEISAREQKARQKTSAIVPDGDEWPEDIPLPQSA